MDAAVTSEVPRSVRDAMVCWLLILVSLISLVSACGSSSPDRAVWSVREILQVGQSSREVSIALRQRDSDQWISLEIGFTESSSKRRWTYDFPTYDHMPKVTDRVDDASLPLIEKLFDSGATVTIGDSTYVISFGVDRDPSVESCVGSCRVRELVAHPR